MLTRAGRITHGQPIAEVRPLRVPKGSYRRWSSFRCTDQAGLALGSTLRSLADPHGLCSSSQSLGRLAVHLGNPGLDDEKAYLQFVESVETILAEEQQTFWRERQRAPAGERPEQGRAAHREPPYSSTLNLGSPYAER